MHARHREWETGDRDRALNRNWKQRSPSSPSLGDRHYKGTASRSPATKAKQRREGRDRGQKSGNRKVLMRGIDGGGERDRERRRRGGNARGGGGTVVVEQMMRFNHSISDAASPAHTRALVPGHSRVLLPSFSAPALKPFSSVASTSPAAASTHNRGRTRNYHRTNQNHKTSYDHNHTRIPNHSESPKRKKDDGAGRTQMDRGSSLSVSCATSRDSDGKASLQPCSNAPPRRLDHSVHVASKRKKNTVYHHHSLNSTQTAGKFIADSGYFQYIV